MALSAVSRNSSTGSIYKNKNIITGLASGLDTEALVENSVLGFKTKIQSLLGNQTKLAWKQDAYRSIIDKMVGISDKYTSYTSKSNLASPSFFNNAIKNITNGTFKDKISAIGRTNSSVSVNAVKQVARAATYRVGTSGFGGKQERITGEQINWNGETEISDLTGSLTLKTGNRSFTLNFDENDVVKSADELAQKINDKLEAYSNDVDGSQYVKAEVQDGKVVFSAGEKLTGGDAIFISGASGNLQKKLGIETGKLGDTAKGRSIDFSIEAKDAAHSVKTAELLSNKTIDVTLDGVTKKIQISDLTKVDPENVEDQLLSDINAGLKKSFGDKVTATITSGSGDAAGRLQFTLKDDGSTLKVSSLAGKSLGIGSTGITSYLDTGKTLSDLLGDKFQSLEAITYKGDVSKLTEEEDGVFKDEAGNRYAKDGDEYYRVDSEGNKLYDLKINDVSVGAFSAKSSLDTVLSAINNSDAGVKVSYSQFTDKFTFEARETGAAGRIDFDDNLGSALFGGYSLRKDEYGMVLDSDGNYIKAGTMGTGNDKADYYLMKVDGTYYRADKDGLIIGDDQGDPYEIDPSEITEAMRQKARDGYTAGQDAVAIVTVNGEAKEVTRSGNILNVDGLSITLKEVFNKNAHVYGNNVYNPVIPADGGPVTEGKKLSADESVTFTAKADADKIYDAVKSFVDDVNAVLLETHKAYSTQPLRASGNRTYEPLSEDEMDGMSDKEIERYEEKAKTGLLFADRDLSNMYDSLRRAVSGSGLEVGDLRDIGITTTYQDGVTALVLDEDAFKAALDANPDKVRDIFARSKDSGASSDGIMAKVSRVMHDYASTTYGDYGVLVKKAGTKLKSMSLTDNYLQKQIDSLDKQIDNWRNKMADRVDYYTKQFSKLEQLMNTMNSQSSALADLMMGGNG